MLNTKKTIVITGCNKGIGYYILEKLAKEHPTYQFIMAVRSLANGKKALEELSQSIPDISSRAQIEELDVSSADSINSFVARLPEKVGKIDALINNAAMAFKGDSFGPEIVQETFQTNFYGTVDLTEKLIDQINDNGKIITVGSLAGRFRILKSEDLQTAFKDRELNREKLFGLAKLFYDSVKDDTYGQKGFPKSAYGMSKLCVNLYSTQILARQEEILKRKIQVYTLCPGHCRTDMAGPKAPKSAEEGAETPAYLVGLPWEYNEELQGKFFSESKVITLD